VKRASLLAFEEHADACPTCRKDKSGWRDALCAKGWTLFSYFLRDELGEPLN
jgi:hypothetical protein